MMNNKKGQVIMEFLMTYGWIFMLLIILGGFIGLGFLINYILDTGLKVVIFDIWN